MMNILIISGKPGTMELTVRLGMEHHVDHVVDIEDIDIDDLDRYDAVFDLDIEDHTEVLDIYCDLENTIIITSGVKTSLAELIFTEVVEQSFTLVGINDLPGFMGREKAEVSLLRDSDAIRVIAFFKALNWPCLIVKDRVGMVSPRIIMMIINEAAYTLQEGTASATDIDESMKLGTNYPFGPFEWCDRIGIDDVYETLESLYNDTHDERYKVCPILKMKYLKGESWY